MYRSIAGRGQARHCMCKLIPQEVVHRRQPTNNINQVKTIELILVAVLQKKKSRTSGEAARVKKKKQQW